MVSLQSKILEFGKLPKRILAYIVICPIRVMANKLEALIRWFYLCLPGRSCLLIYRSRSYDSNHPSLNESWVTGDHDFTSPWLDSVGMYFSIFQESNLLHEHAYALACGAEKMRAMSSNNMIWPNYQCGQCVSITLLQAQLPDKVSSEHMQHVCAHRNIRKIKLCKFQSQH